MSLILLKCSNCGADLNAEGSTQFFRCHYCGKTSLNPSFTAASVAQPVAPVPPTAHVAPPAGTILPAGTRVWAQWSGGSAGRFYPSTVIGFQGGRYHIAWDDGSAPTWEDPPRVMIPTSATPSNAQPGMHVAAMWTNGMHYGARVSQVDPRGLLVAWDDGTPPSWVQFGDVFVPGASAQASGTWSAAQGRFAPGAHVQARWQHGSYYGAVVLAFDGARYQLRWDDGTAPTWVDQSEVQPG